jgi:hypothetical protein
VSSGIRYLRLLFLIFLSSTASRSRRLGGVHTFGCRGRAVITWLYPIALCVTSQTTVLRIPVTQLAYPDFPAMAFRARPKSIQSVMPSESSRQAEVNLPRAGCVFQSLTSSFCSTFMISFDSSHRGQIRRDHHCCRLELSAFEFLDGRMFNAWKLESKVGGGGEEKCGAVRGGPRGRFATPDFAGVCFLTPTPSFSDVGIGN